MAQPVISVENLSKAYRIGAKEEVPDTLMSAAVGLIRSPFKNFQRLRSLSTIHNGDEGDDILWALKDVSFEVNQGDVVGIIGRNGAGKSTLLKVLSRITEPTSGRATIRGRVSSLLEVGTGFHPELTGRENVYMNGTILGMTKKEIDRKFDEIVEFSGVEKFLDTPTKRYSSGMQVRLAFAVAANLEPEILIIDEVLAVGDSEFQEKCLGKMRDVASGGRTILFVSHNLSAIRSLCSRGILISSGSVDTDGLVSDVLKSYTDSVSKSSLIQAGKRTDRSGNGSARIISVVTQGNGDIPISCGSPLTILIDFQPWARDITCSFTVYNGQGDAILWLLDQPWVETDKAINPTGTSLVCTIPECPLLPGSYRINAALYSGSDRVDHLEGVASFDVLPGTMRGRAVSSNNFGMVTAPHRWERI